MMKLLVICVLVFVGLSIAEGAPNEAPAPEPKHSRGCIYILGTCSRECEEGTHSYSLGCDHKTPEPTCDEPNPVAERAILCDYSACYCDAPTVRDTSSGKCVELCDCPKKE